MAKTKKAASSYLTDFSSIPPVIGMPSFLCSFIGRLDGWSLRKLEENEPGCEFSSAFVRAAAAKGQAFEGILMGELANTLAAPREQGAKALAAAAEATRKADRARQDLETLTTPIARARAEASLEAATDELAAAQSASAAAGAIISEGLHRYTDVVLYTRRCVEAKMDSYLRGVARSRPGVSLQLKDLLKSVYPDEPASGKHDGDEPLLRYVA